jgi:murein DD-endopeptidase MepM/ murein hydrolase activator NlpD
MQLRKLSLACALSGLAMIVATSGIAAVTPALLAPSGALPAAAPTPRGPRIYKLPFPGGSKFEVCQGYNHSGGTHSGAAAYAWDFCMPIGSPVTAARGGTVRAVRQDSKVGGWGPQFADDANYVVVDHGDGTSGLYMHLMFNGARVKPGDQVRVGQLIAYSGNTGWTSAPHLHFMVMQTEADNVYSQSIPVLFQDVPSDGGLPLEDKTYTSGNERIDAKLMSAGGPPPFTPFWVETFRPSSLWSGSDDKAIKFGTVPSWQFFQVIAPQDGPRLRVIVAATGQPAFVPAVDVGPSGPPPAAASSAPAAQPAGGAAGSPGVPAKADAAGQVVVSAGDTLYAIARAHHVSPDALAALNGLKDPNDLNVGQTLKIG